jgi:hypothetical protein
LGEKKMMQYIWMTLAGLLAFGTGRGIIRWTLAAYLLGPLALLVLVCLPKKENKIQDRVDAVKDKSEEYIVKQEFKGVNTVDDLFKQLETPRG